VKNSSERGGDGAEAREKLGEEEGARALLGENAFGAANAGIGLDRNLANELKNPDAFAQA
jgi:hypothetical protein